MKSLRDKQIQSYIEIAPNKEAARVIADDFNKAIPENWKGITVSYTGDNITTVEYFSDAAKTNLITTLNISYSGSNIIGVTSV